MLSAQPFVDPDSASIIGGSLSISGPVAVIRLRTSRAANNSTHASLRLDHFPALEIRHSRWPPIPCSVPLERHRQAAQAWQASMAKHVPRGGYGRPHRRQHWPAPSQTLEHASRRSHSSEYPDDDVTKTRPRPRSPPRQHPQNRRGNDRRCPAQDCRQSPRRPRDNGCAKALGDTGFFGAAFIGNRETSKAETGCLVDTQTVRIRAIRGSLRTGLPPR
jgi:hypothetical protein